MGQDITGSLQKRACWSAGADGKPRGTVFPEGLYCLRVRAVGVGRAVARVRHTSVSSAVRMLAVCLLLCGVAPAHAFSLFGGKKETETVRDPTPYSATLNAGGGALDR